jgi:hypothetical protein
MKIDWGKIGIEELAALTSEKLRQEGVDSILAGGACVSIYTKNKYESFDLDFVTHATIFRSYHDIFHKRLVSVMGDYILTKITRAIKKGLHLCKPLILLVAGRGFEPLTFGL